MRPIISHTSHPTEEMMHLPDVLAALLKEED